MKNSLLSLPPECGVPVGRFAPTPSGFLHPGNLLCAMLSYLSIRSSGGKCLLRIEDLDTPRCPEHLVRQAISDLEFLGFRWDDPVIFQSTRSDVYEIAFLKLQQMGLVYPCFCSRAQLHATDAPNRGDTLFLYPGTCRNLTPSEIAARQTIKSPAYRLRVPSESISFYDHVAGRFTADPAQNPGDFILRRADGIYAYHLAVVVDDALSGVTQVVRGNDILSATPCHFLLQTLLDFPHPDYYHIPLLTDAHGRRFAKREKSISLSALSQRYTKDEIIGALAFAAHLIPEFRPISLEALIPLFSWEKIPNEDLRLPDFFAE